MSVQTSPPSGDSRVAPGLQTGLHLQPCSATAFDGQLVMAWRNDVATRVASFHREPKVWAEFGPQFIKDYMGDPDCPALFLVAGGERVAFVRFAPDPILIEGLKVRTLSIMVSPDHRSRGYGVLALREAMALMAGRGRRMPFLAIVRAENAVSHRMFLKASWTPFDESAHRVEDTGEVCAVVRYLAWS